MVKIDRRGDKGKTSLVSGERVDKYDTRVEACGDLDEASACMGAARMASQVEDVGEVLLFIQKKLFDVSAEISALPESKLCLQRKDITQVEGLIQDVAGQIDMPTGFVLAGGTGKIGNAGALTDMARTMIRRAERRAAKLKHDELLLNQNLLTYLNRLSDLLWYLARLEEQGSGGKTLSKD